MQALKARVRRLYRANSHHYPSVYNAQQRASVALRARFGVAHEQSFEALPLLGLPKDASCIDVGANLGQSIVSIKRFLPEARIDAFEPNPYVWPNLERTAARFGGVHLHLYGLAGESADLTLYVPRCRSIVFHQLAATAPPDRELLLENLRRWGFTFASSRDVVLEERRISTRRLDDLALAPHFIKIDVEGSEIDVLRGAGSTLKRRRPVLMIEGGSRPEIADALQTIGYRCYVYEGNSLREGRSGDALNSFFISDRAEQAEPK